MDALSTRLNESNDGHHDTEAVAEDGQTTDPQADAAAHGLVVLHFAAFERGKEGVGPVR